MTKDEALTLALEALERLALPKNADDIFRRATVAIKETLAQPEQEPEGAVDLFEYWNAVEGWVKIEEVRKHFGSVGCGTIYKTAGEDRVPLYTAPKQRPWVGLTDEDKDAIIRVTESDHYHDILMLAEAKLKEKNT